VTLRPASATIVSLLGTLQKLEETLVAPEDAHALAEIKHIILLRIAELSASDAIGSAVSEVAPSVTPADLPIPAHEYRNISQPAPNPVHREPTTAADSDTDLPSREPV